MSNNIRKASLEKKGIDVIANTLPLAEIIPPGAE